MSRNNDFLAYRANPIKHAYDVESLGDVFTNIIIRPGRVHVQLVADEAYNVVTDRQILSLLASRQGESFFDQVLGPNPVFSLTRSVSGEPNRQLTKELFAFLNCTPMWETEGQWGQRDFCEYYGWNSDFYDAPLLSAVHRLGLKRRHAYKASEIKALSDAIINYNGPAWKLPEELAPVIEKSAAVRDGLRNNYELMRWANGHIDLGKLAKAEDSEEDNSLKRFPPGLKREMSRYGMDIVEDESVRYPTLAAAPTLGANGEPKSLADKLLDLIGYNLNDVLGTFVISGNTMLSERGLAVRDIVRELYPYTDARYGCPQVRPQFNASRPRNFPERDITAANLSALVVVGQKRSKPVDKPVISYEFPVPGEDKPVDLLERMKTLEDMPADLYTFFSHFRGKDTREWADHWRVVNSQPLTKSAQVNIPYYRRGADGVARPTDSYIRVSTGGAHGGIFAGLSSMSAGEIAAWTRANRDVPSEVVPTIDMQNVIHIDWTSFYPTMISKTGMFVTPEGDDNYTAMIEHRVRIKKALPRNKAEWTNEHKQLNRQQDGLKLGLNSPTGKANTHSRYALLDLDNATMSMRLMGNMHIWCLAQRLTQAGGFIIATNTDGVFVANMNLEQAQEIVDGYMADYGLGVEPELVDRFINRNTSTRIEYSRNASGQLVPVAIGGELKAAASMTHSDSALGSNMTYPLACGHAALKYMDNPAWLTEKYDRARLRSILEDLRSSSDDVAGWFFTYSGTASRRLVSNGRPLVSKVNRLAFTYDGEVFSQDVSSVPAVAQTARLLELGLDFDAWCAEFDIEVANQVDLSAEYGNDWSLVTFEKDQWGNILPGIDVYAHLMKGNSFTPKLAFYFHGQSRVEPLKIWKRSSSLFGTDRPVRGVRLQSRQDYLDFELSTLNLDFYVQWAEQILARWKVTADVPELGLVSCDDTVRFDSKPVRLTARQWQERKLSDVYGQLYGFDVYEKGFTL